LPLEHRGIPHVCLVEFRARLVRAGMADWLHERLLAVAKAAGVIGHRRMVDSTGIADCVVTQDTVTLIRSATRRCLDRLREIDPERSAATEAGLARSDYRQAGKPLICWASPTERGGLVNDLFTDAVVVVTVCDAIDDAALAAEVELLRIVSAQDVEETSEGRVQIRQGVAPDRVISTVDPDARHGHRSRRDRYDGYKLHLSVDVDSDLFVAGEATAATVADGEILDALIDADPVAVAEVTGDTHYGSVDVRRGLADHGIEIVAPAPPASSPKGYFSKNDFAIDLEGATVTCPAGHTVNFRVPTGTRVQVRFPAAVCVACPLHDRCTKCECRIIEINPDEGLLASARRARWTPEFRHRYRERARIERKNAQFKSRAAKIPWRGLPKAGFWVKLRMAALNLDRLGRTAGLIG
jgi:hypothetical protein